MTIRSYWNRVDPLRHLRQKHAAKDILSCKEFQAMLELERCQADRIGYEFSLVVFEGGDTGNGGDVAESVGYSLMRRVRITDKVGWFTEMDLGVILSGTPAEGATKFADKMSRKAAEQNVRLIYRVYTYPSAWFPGVTLRSFQRRSGDGSLDAAVEPISSAVSGDLRTELNVPKGLESRYGAFQGFAEGLEPVLLHTMPGWKRSVDILCSVFGLIVLSPLFLATAILIKIISSGPVLFKQERVGYLGRPFTLLKFRTMRVEADDSVHRRHVSHLIQGDGSLTKLDSYDDPRIIPLGKLLRTSGIDELPQLINVLRGEMSIVGPRPDVAYSVQDYLPWNIRRLDVLPGLTGLWQVSGKNNTTFKDMIRLDIMYARQKSIWFDLKIIALTIPSILLSNRKDGLKLKTVNYENRSKMTACKAMIGRLGDRILF